MMRNLSSGPAKKASDAPFAQSENLVEADYPSSFHLQKHNKQVNDKVRCHLSKQVQSLTLCVVQHAGVN